MYAAPQPYLHLLNQYFDHIYVITINRAIDRQEKIREILKGLDFEFFYGVDKLEFPFSEMKKRGMYDEEQAKQYHRYGKPMTHGHVACSLSHKSVYEDVVEKNYGRVLIFEDDVVPDFDNFHYIPSILKEMPQDWELVYWGYGNNEQPDKTKQSFYRILSALKLLKWNSTMVKNLYPVRISAHISKAGFHDMTHAFSLTQSGARALVKLQTPVTFNADNALSYASKNELINAYICHPKIFNQEMTVNPDTYRSLIHH